MGILGYINPISMDIYGTWLYVVYVIQKNKDFSNRKEQISSRTYRAGWIPGKRGMTMKFSIRKWEFGHPNDSLRFRETE